MSTLSELRETVGISVGAMSRLVRRPRTVVESYEGDSLGFLEHDPTEGKRLMTIYEAMAGLLKAANS